MTKRFLMIMVMVSWCSVGFADDCKGNCTNGQGTYTWSNKGTYVGEFKNGQMHGQGTMIWKKNGNKYIGEWDNAKMHGQGTLIFPDGRKYVGEFKNSKWHGQGTLTRSNGTIDKGIWKDNKLVERNQVGISVAEKPKTNLAESIDYQATLVKYGLTLEDHTVVMEFTFNSNLTGSYVGYPKKKKKKSYSKFKYDGFNQYGETIIRFEGTSLKKKGFHTLSMKVNFDTGIVISEGFKATIVSPRKSQVIAKKPEKKPEKKKPIKKKPSPDDEKIIIIGKGSGFFINDKGHIVSNAHVVGVCKKVIAYEEGEEITLKILATDMVNDIGLVKGKFNNKQYLNIKTDGAELGEQIVVFGYPLSQELSDSVKLTQGIVSSLSGPDNNYSKIQIDAAIQPGNSGGPVVNMNGQVVGIASAGLSKLYMLQKADYIPENVNFAVAAQSLTTFLKANKMKVTSGPTRIYSTKELAKIGEPATIQLICMNTMAEYEKLKKSNKHSDMLLDLQ